MRTRASLVLCSLLIDLSLGAGSAFAEPAAGKAMTSGAVYVIDDVEVPRIVFDAFRASLSSKLVDQAGTEYVAQNQGNRHSLQRKPPAKPAAVSTQFTIDGLQVSKAIYDAFRASLKEVKGTWFCDEMNDGGETGVDGMAKDGTRYAVRELSSSRRGNHSSINRVKAKNP